MVRDSIRMAIATLKTRIGQLGLEETDGKITRLLWNAENAGSHSPVLSEGLVQLKAYFDGRLSKFDLPLDPAGSPFQKQVYRAMCAIPAGETRTYGEIAKDLDVAAQPVGQACGSNPIPIIIPCHRVVGAKGLTGFSGMGGVETKVELLKLEGAYSLLI